MQSVSIISISLDPLLAIYNNCTITHSFYMHSKFEQSHPTKKKCTANMIKITEEDEARNACSDALYKLQNFCSI